MNSFIDRLADAVGRLKNPVSVGLDPRIESLPQGLLPIEGVNDWNEQAQACKRFCMGVIDVVAPLVPAVKPQAAFFERLGPSGMGVLAEIMAYAREKGLLVILDGKRNDIGSTATAYAQGFLGAGGQSPWGADALTVNPYLGEDSLRPFIDVARERSAGVFVLVKTSNPGGRMIQDLLAGGQPIFAHVAEYVERMAAETAGDCGYGIVGAVAGATYPRQLAELRGDAPYMVSSARLRGSRRIGRRCCRRIRWAGKRRDHQQFPGHHLRPCHKTLLRALRRFPLAGGRGIGYPRHDRPASRRHSRRAAITSQSRTTNLTNVIKMS